MKKRIGYIGLGIMGGSMAEHLINKGYKVNIISRESKKTKLFIKKFKKSKNLQIFSSLSELTRNSEIIISCVGDDKDLMNIYISNNMILDNVKPNTLIIDHTTSSVTISKLLHKKFKKKKSFFFDAPVSGGEIGAKNATLSIMIGGNKKQFQSIKKVINVYSKSSIYMGKSGNGQLTKMVNQICVAAVIQGLAEGLSFAKRKKLNIDKLIEVISKGAAQSWQLENRAATMWKGKFNFGFMNKLMLKDLKLISNEISKTDLKLPTTKMIMNSYKKLINLGFGEEDTSNLIRLLR